MRRSKPAASFLRDVLAFMSVRGSIGACVSIFEDRRIFVVRSDKRLL